MGENRILYVETQRDYSQIVAKYLSSERIPDFIFVPNVVHERMLIAEAAQQGISIERRVLQFKTIDAGLDDYLYHTCRDLAEKLVSFVLSSSGLLEKDREFLISDRMWRPLRTVFMDRLVSQLRAPLLLARYAEAMDSPKLHVALRAGSSFFLLSDFLALYGMKEFEPLTDHLTLRQAHTIKIDRRWQPQLAPQYVPLPSFDYDRMVQELGDQRAILFMTNMRDKMYRLAALPILQQLNNASARIILMTAYDEDNERPEEFKTLDAIYCSKSVKGGSIPVNGEFPGADKLALNVLSRFRRWGRTSPDKNVAALIEFSAGYLAPSLVPQTVHARTFVSRTAGILAKTQAVVTLPGRYIEGALLIEQARSLSIPTFEIQSGTISTTPRFVAPLAEQVLCIDQFSRSVYCDYLGLPHNTVKVVGSPKIDYDLRAVAGISRTKARNKLKQFGFPRKGKVVMFASQPIGAERMKAAVELLIEALEPLKDHSLFIKQHHNEDEQYLKAYLAVSEQRGFDRMIVSKEAHVLTAVVAADTVCTYYSTVGLEAFCLRRPVICVNPFEGEPPFKLCQLGVAIEAKDAETLRGHILKADGAEPSEETLRFLQDGKAAQRCAQEILDACSRMAA